MHAAHARQVCLHKLQFVLPARGGQVGLRVEASEHGVLAPVLGRPQLAQPLLLAFHQGHDRARLVALQVQVRHAFERFGDGERDVVEIRHLLGEDAARAEHDVDDFRAVFAVVDQPALQRLLVHLARQLRELPFGQLDKGAAQARIEA